MPTAFEIRDAKMDANSESKEAFWRALFGLLYGFILFFLSFGAAGGPEGGGIGIPFVISSAPLSASADFGSLLYGTPLLWAFLGYSTALSFRWIPQFLFLLHYPSGVALTVMLVKMGAGVVSIGGWVIAWALVYLGGQVVFWRAIGRIRRAD
jgi:hypothetical protein